jgi:predicted enzyme related to lactoylglutathione lyase
MIGTYQGILVDALYPRVLTTRFADCFRFYDAVLTDIVGAHRVKGTQDGPYANWDLGSQAVLSLLDRRSMAQDTGLDLPASRGSGGDSVMLVIKVDDVERAAEIAAGHGGDIVVPAVDRPEWGPTCRTAHLRDPEGNLVELQSY